MAEADHPELEALAGAWIEHGGNRDVWRGFIDWLTPARGFSVRLVVCPRLSLARGVLASVQTLTTKLAREYRRALVPGPRHAQTHPSPVTELTAAPRQPCLAILDTLGEGWHRAEPEQIRFALSELDHHCDVLAERLDGPLLIVVDRDGRELVREHARRLWSVADEIQFGFAQDGRPVRGRGKWMTTVELAGQLRIVDGFGHMGSTRAASLVRPIPAPIELLGRSAELSILRQISEREPLVIIDGADGSGRSSLAARFVADEGGRWERVVWLDATGDENIDLGLYSILSNLRPDLPPPRTQLDLLAAYRRETRRNRVLIVIESRERSDRWPPPSPGSFVIVKSAYLNSALKVTSPQLRVKPLLRTDVLALWSRVCEDPPPRTLQAFDRNWPGIVVALGRAPRALRTKLDEHLLNERVPSELDFEQHLSDDARKLWRRLNGLPSGPMGLPRMLIAEPQIEHFAELVESGIVDDDGAWLRLRQLPRYPSLGKSQPLIELVEIADRFDDSTADFQRRLLRSATAGLTDLLLRERRFPQFDRYVDQMASVLLPWELPGFLDRVHRIVSPERVAGLQLALMRAHLDVCNADIRVDVLHNVRRQLDQAEVASTPSDRRALDRLTLEVALAQDDHVRIRELLRTGPGIDPGLVEHFEQICGGTENSPLGKLYAGSGDLQIGQTLASAADPPTRHLGYLSLALDALSRRDTSTLEPAVAGVHQTAEEWGAPLALLRADMLDAEVDRASGRASDALAKLDALTERHDTYLGEHSFAAVDLLEHRLRLANEVRPPHEVLLLADSCLGRARDSGLDVPWVFESLAEVYLGHGAYERASAAAHCLSLVANEDSDVAAKANELARKIARRRFEAEHGEAPTVAPNTVALDIPNYRFDAELQELLESSSGFLEVTGLLRAILRVRPWLEGTILDNGERQTSPRTSIRELLQASVEIAHASIGERPEAVRWAVRPLGVNDLVCALAFSARVRPEDWPLVRPELQLRVVEQIGPPMTHLAQRILDFAKQTSHGEVRTLSSFRLFAACIEIGKQTGTKDIESRVVRHFAASMANTTNVGDLVGVMAASQYAPRGATAFIGDGSQNFLPESRDSLRGRLMIRTAWQLASARDDHQVDAIDLVAALLTRAEAQVWSLLDEYGLTQLSLIESLWAGLDHDCHEALRQRIVPHSVKLKIDEKADPIVETREVENTASLPLAIDVLIITALRTELDALRDVTDGILDGWTSREGDTPYYTAIFQGQSGPIRVAAARLTRMAATDAATKATEFVDRLRPRYLAMCGACAGHPEDTAVGDVIIGDRVFQHDEGKQTIGGFKGDLWVRELDETWLYTAQEFAGPAKGLPGYAEPQEEEGRWWFLGQLLAGRDPRRLSSLPRYLPDSRRSKLLTALLEAGEVELDDDKFKLTVSGRQAIASRQAVHGTHLSAAPYHVLVGPIGSGNAVIGDPDIWTRMTSGGMRKILGIEMEGAAIGAVAHSRSIPFVVVKGVMDHADQHKTDGAKEFAARASAEVLCRFLRRVVAPAGGRSAASDHRLESTAEFEQLRSRRKQKLIAGEDTSDIDREMRALEHRTLEGPPLKANQVLAQRYELLERVGLGAFATVWKAYDRRSENLVAVKILHGHWNTDRSKLERFEIGAEKMMSLRHPAIVPVLTGPERSDHHLYYVMKWYSGGDLERAVTEKKLTRSRALVALADALDGLAYAHERGIVHRDVKPSNILLDERNAGSITDFDLAQAKDTQYWTQTATGLGAIAYAAPEQLEDASAVDWRADIYAAGKCTLFVLRERTPRPQEFHERSSLFESLECGEGLREAVARAVTIDPNDRNLTCSELAKAIRDDVASR